MKKIHKILLVVLMLSSFGAKAQYDGLTFTFLDNIPYNNYYNPGARVHYKGVIGVGISNFNISVINSNLLYKDIYRFENGKPVAVAASNFVGSLKETGNFINTGFSMDVINVGLRMKKSYFSIDYKLRYYGDIDYSRDFLGFFILGNGSYMGEDNIANIDFGVDMGVYTELGVGFQYDIKDNLTVGGRVKLLNGVVNIGMSDMKVDIYTDPDTYAMTASSLFDIRMSSVGNTQIYHFSDMGDIFNELDFFHNLGFAVDLGATYKLNKHLGFGASLLDLGYIKWNDSKVHKHERNDFVLNDAVVEDIEDILDMSFDYMGVVSGIVENIIGDDTLLDGGSYKTSLRTRAMLQAYYELSPMLRVTAMTQLCINKGEVTPIYTLAYSGVFLRMLSLTANYTYSGYVGGSLGAGLGVHLGPLNIYAASDNVLLAFHVHGKEPISKLVTSYPVSNIRFGLVWTIGRNEIK